MAALAVDRDGADHAVDEGRPRAIDLAFLARQTMGNKNLENDILQLYRRQLRNFEPDWAIAKDLPEFDVTLHGMRSAALGVGATSIAALSRALEIELSQNGAGGREIYVQLGEAVRAALAFIEQILGE